MLCDMMMIDLRVNHCLSWVSPLLHPQYSPTVCLVCIFLLSLFDENIANVIMAAKVIPTKKLV